MIKKFSVIRLLITIAALSLTLFSSSAMADRLEDIHHKIELNYKEVQHLTADEYNGLDMSNLVVFDVREEKEYQVSHLDQAIRVSPSMSPEDFISQHVDLLKTNIAVFYCSVGRRSSKFVHAIETSELTNNQEFELYNLEGGIFRWVNDERDIENGVIHPYNWYWGRLIDDKDKISYKPVD